MRERDGEKGDRGKQEECLRGLESDEGGKNGGQDRLLLSGEVPACEEKAEEQDGDGCGGSVGCVVGGAKSRGSGGGQGCG